MSLQRTLAIVKPNMLTLLKDGSLQRYSIEQSMAICSKFATENNFKVIDSKTVHLSRLQAEAFYNEHRGKFFYPRLVSYMSSGTLGVLILEAPNAVQRWRSLIGPTNRRKALTTEPNSFRSNYGLSDTRNAVHGSDSVDQANREIEFFFQRRI